MKIDGKQVHAAILQAETGTTARIGVHVSEKNVRDALEHAEERFQHAQMHRHPAGNAVLILVAPKSRQVAVYAGPAAHARLGENFWSAIVDEMTPLFAQNRPTDAIVHGIERIGSALQQQFPVEGRE